jgi:hypothetical protein
MSRGIDRPVGIDMRMIGVMVMRRITIAVAERGRGIGIAIRGCRIAVVISVVWIRVPVCIGRIGVSIIGIPIISIRIAVPVSVIWSRQSRADERARR